MSEVVLEGVSKVYPDGTAAVLDLDLRVGDGEFMCLVGPSGCGKTTALRMVAGLEDITAGTIRIGERVVNDVPPKDRDIAMVFQNYALYPHLSVARNMGFGLKLRKVPRAEIDRRVRHAARILGLDELLDRKPRALSGGQRQRVAMGRAIVREPSAFLMDEPLSNLDAKLRVQMRAEIARIQRDLDVTTLYVTHDQVEAMTMADRVAVIKKGVLQQVDEPQVLYDRPVNLFVGGFIGSPAMNLFEAQLGRGDDRDGNGLWVTLGPQRLRVADDLVAQRPGLRARIGQPIVVGIRPEDLEDASLVGAGVPVGAGTAVGAAAGSPGQRIRAQVDLVEQMGSEAYVHLTIDARPVLTEDTRELARDTGAVIASSSAEVGNGSGSGPGSGTSCVARVHPRTGAAKGRPIDLVVDTSRLHFFDLTTGEAVWD